MNFIKLTDKQGRTFYLNFDKVGSFQWSESERVTTIFSEDVIFKAQEKPEQILDKM
jgi:hypothetical protein